MSEQTEANYEEWYRAMFFRALDAEEQVASLREELRVAKAERDALQTEIARRNILFPESGLRSVPSAHAPTSEE